MAGQEIYSILAGRSDVEINIQSLAGSAASVIAMANTCKMSPVATIMITMSQCQELPEIIMICRRTQKS